MCLLKLQFSIKQHCSRKAHDIIEEQNKALATVGNFGLEEKGLWCVQILILYHLLFRKETNNVYIQDELNQASKHAEGLF